MELVELGLTRGFEDKARELHGPDVPVARVTAVDRGRRQLLIFESHALVAHGLERVSDYQFVMRC